MKEGGRACTLLPVNRVKCRDRVRIRHPSPLSLYLLRRAALAGRTVLDKALVVPHQKLRLNSLHRLDSHTNDNQQRRAADKGDAGKSSQARHNVLRYRDAREKHSSRKRDARNHAVQIVIRRLARSDTRDVVAVFFQVVRHLLHVHNDGRVEVGKTR